MKGCGDLDQKIVLINPVPSMSALAVKARAHRQHHDLPNLSAGNQRVLVETG